MTTITTRSGKGSPLTNNEVDANFTNLNSDKAELSGATFTGAITANAGVVVDNITIDGNEIDVSSGDLTLDVAGDIILDAGGAEVKLKSNGTQFGDIYTSSSHLYIQSSIPNKDLKFEVNDNGSILTALTLDGSAAGAATFASSVTTTLLNIIGDSKLGQDFAYFKSNSASNASLTLRKDSSGADSIDYLQLRNDGNGLLGKITGAGVIHTKGADLDGGVVINNAGGDVDFTVKSNGNANMLFVDGGNNKVGIGVVPVEGALTIKSAGNTYATSALVLEDADSTTRTYITHVNGDLAISNNSSRDDLILDSSGNLKVVTGALQLADIAQSIDFIQSGAINFDSNGDQTGRVLVIGSNRANGESGGVTNVRFDETGGSHFNDGGLDADFRVESNSNTHALFVEGSSGNVLVGKSSSNNGAVGIQAMATGDINATVSNDTVARFNRLSGDGEILRFQKDTATVGSIGCYADKFYIGDGDTGICFVGEDDVVLPCSPSSNNNRDNAITLGAAAVRFKDLYLSGGVFLGGTGAANKLDDYEEGTWTPTLPSGGSLTVHRALYTKIGRQVSVQFYITAINATNDGAQFKIGNLPFTTSSISDSFSAGSISYSGQSDLSGLGLLNIVNGTSLYFHFIDGTSGSSVANNTFRGLLASASAGVMIAEISYFTD